MNVKKTHNLLNFIYSDMSLVKYCFQNVNNNKVQMSSFQLFLSVLNSCFMLEYYIVITATE